jgi:SAM-dependent methyltransferase
MAEVALLERMWRQGQPKSAAYPATLREDFAGTCSVASAWCMSDPHRQALAVERDLRTLRWAERRHRELLEEDRLYIVLSDVMDFAGPRVDVVCALNFSICEWHTRSDLLAYLRHARRRLNPAGIVVINLYGGPGSERPGTQHRPFLLDGRRMQYHWQQRSFDPLTRRAVNAIHFEKQGPITRNAFRYDWRLWTLPELGEAMHEAGLEPSAWMDAGRGYRAVKRWDGEGRDWVGYVVGRR